MELLKGPLALEQGRGSLADYFQVYWDHFLLEVSHKIGIQRDTDPLYEVKKAANPTLRPPATPLVTFMTEKQGQVDMTDLYDSTGLSPQVSP
eukprot:3666859-Amphidinium_carterae.3